MALQHAVLDACQADPSAHTVLYWQHTTVAALRTHMHQPAAIADETNLTISSAEHLVILCGTVNAGWFRL